MHELEIMDGEAMMAYAGSEVPWHGLGKSVGFDLSPREMQKAAGLDWTVSKRPLYSTPLLVDGEPAPIIGTRKIPGQYGLFRDSDEKFLSVVGPNYIPVQNHEAFDFFHDFVEAGEMAMHTAGSLRGARMVWALAKMSTGFRLKGGDEVESHLLIASPHELGKALIIRFTPIRVVCWNTLSLALRGTSKDEFRMPHIKNFDVDVREAAAAAIGLSTKLMKQYEEQAKFLASKPARPNDVKRFIAEIFGKDALSDDADEEIDLEETNRACRQAMEQVTAQPGAELASSKGTWWGAFNATTYFIDHVVGHNREASLHNAWFGPRARDKNRAMTKALEYAKAS